MIGALTGISRVLGFIRDVIIATAFGTGVAAEAFVVSFKIPNLFRDLVAEGAASAAFVPVLTECRQKKPQDFWVVASTLLWMMGGVLLVLSVLGMIFAPAIVALLVPGFTQSADPSKFPLTVHLTRWIFPYLFLIGLSALMMGILNSLQEFTSSALGPALLNICMIITGLFFEKTYGPMALVAGVLVGGVLQLIFQIRPLKQLGFRWERPQFHHEAVQKIGKLLVPRALGSALYQINILVDSVLASFESIVGAGGQSALYYANRLFQLPMAILGLSLAQAILPTLSTQIAQNDLGNFKKTLTMAVRMVFLAVLPAAVGLALLAKPIIRIIFEHGKFDTYSTQITSDALFFYAFGLVSCVLIKVFANAFYAMHDTKTPVKIMLLSVSLNAVLSFFLMHSMKIGGLTLASSISATVNMGFLYFLLTRKIGRFEESLMMQTIGRCVVAVVMMALWVVFYHQRVLSLHGEESHWMQALWLGVGIFSAVIVYFGTALLLGVEEIKKLFYGRQQANS